MVSNCRRILLLYAICLIFLAVGGILNLYFLPGKEEVVIVAEKEGVTGNINFTIEKMQRSSNDEESSYNNKNNSLRTAMFSDPSCPFDARGVPSRLLPGDLPGYTGWPRRPSLTLPNYSIISVGSFPVEDDTLISEDKLVHRIADDSAIGSLWSVVVHCPTKECQDSSPAFYARSYGPAIITGDIRTFRVSPVGTGSSEAQNNDVGYEVQFRYRIPGSYIVELVLESEDAIPLSNFPRKLTDGLKRSISWEPTYRGWLMPGFPLQIEVIDSGSREMSSLHNTSKRWCSAEEIVSDTTGQWVVTGRYDQKVKDVDQGNAIIGNSMLRGYRNGLNSIGACTKYMMGSNCELLPTESLGSGKRVENIFLSQCMKDANVIAR